MDYDHQVYNEIDNMSYRISVIEALRVTGGGILRGHFKGILGYTRYFLYKPAINDYHDLSILQLVIYGCGLSLSKNLLERLLRKEPTAIQFNDGSRFVVEDIEDFYHASMCYEPKTLRFILNHLQNGGIFVDVGANIGGYTIRVAKKARVYALEPHPRNFRLLKLNLKLNQEKVKNVNIFQAAAGAYSGEAKLFLSDYHGRHSLLSSNGNSDNRLAIDVDIITLDSILVNEDNINIIKIDVESAEPLVLKGANETLRKTDLVIVEASSPSFYHTSNILAKYSFKPIKN